MSSEGEEQYALKGLSSKANIWKLLDYFRKIKSKSRFICFPAQRTPLLPTTVRSRVLKKKKPHAYFRRKYTQLNTDGWLYDFTALSIASEPRRGVSQHRAIKISDIQKLKQ